MLYDMLPVNYFLGYSIFKQVISIFFSNQGNLAQFVSTWISLGQVKNIGRRPQVTGHCLPIREVS